MGLKVVHNGFIKKNKVRFAVKWRGSCKNSFVRVCILKIGFRKVLTIVGLLTFKKFIS